MGIDNRITNCVYRGRCDIYADWQKLEAQNAGLVIDIGKLKAELEKQRLIILDYYNHSKNNHQICGINTRAEKALRKEK